MIGTSRERRGEGVITSPSVIRHVVVVFPCSTLRGERHQSKSGHRLHKVTSLIRSQARPGHRLHEVAGYTRSQAR